MVHHPLDAILYDNQMEFDPVRGLEN